MKSDVKLKTKIQKDSEDGEEGTVVFTSRKDAIPKIQMKISGPHRDLEKMMKQLQVLNPGHLLSLELKAIGKLPVDAEDDVPEVEADRE